MGRTGGAHIRSTTDLCQAIITINAKAQIRSKRVCREKRNGESQRFDSGLKLALRFGNRDPTLFEDASISLRIKGFHRKKWINSQIWVTEVIRRWLEVSLENERFGSGALHLRFSNTEVWNQDSEDRSPFRKCFLNIYSRNMNWQLRIYLHIRIIMILLNYLISSSKLLVQTKFIFLNKNNVY